ncbi:MAG: response regulator transcription factor [Alphaproteobacteria bacterium]
MGQITKDRSVLVVDDDGAYAQAIVTYLERQGVEAVAAESGEAAVSLARRDHPAVILLDIGLPDMDGMEVAVLVQEATYHPRIILLSGCIEWLQLGAMSGVEIVDSVAKPTRLSVIAERIRAWLPEHIGPAPAMLGPAAG